MGDAEIGDVVLCVAHTSIVSESHTSKSYYSHRYQLEGQLGPGMRLLLFLLATMISQTWSEKPNLPGVNTESDFGSIDDNTDQVGLSLALCGPSLQHRFQAVSLANTGIIDEICTVRGYLGSF